MPLGRPLGRLAAGLAAALLLVGAGPAPAPVSEGPTPADPAAAAFRLGALKLIALRDAGFVSPNDSSDFGINVGPAAVAAALQAAGAPTDRITLSVDALAIEAPGRIMLLDTGVGPSAGGVLMQSLALARISPADVTDVLITHSHFDHVGGLLGPGGTSAFPKAAVWISAREWAWMKSGKEDRKLVAAIGPQVRPFEPGHEILPGVTPIALYGHTPGHVGYLIRSGGRTLEDIGDIAHSSIASLAHPAWTEMDEDMAAGAATRVRELTRLAAARQLIFAPHFPFPGIGWIVAGGQGFRWRPDPAVGR